jgi:hypothetical protein
VRLGPACGVVRRCVVAVLAAAALAPAPVLASPPPSSDVSSGPPARAGRAYPWHHHVVATTFWVGEVFRPDEPDGSQVLSTYDGHWMQHYGGCDGVVWRVGTCETEQRVRSNGWFPRHMRPRENPFYLDVPFDDVNDDEAFATRCEVVPWAARSRYRGRCDDRDYSFMKNRWVELIGPNGRRCYGQVQDAGPGEYDDAAYVFGSGDVSPVNKAYNGAGMDVSPALNGCLGFADLDGDQDQVSWRFVDRRRVRPGPWLRLVTWRQVSP